MFTASGARRPVNQVKSNIFLLKHNKIYFVKCKNEHEVETKMFYDIAMKICSENINELTLDISYLHFVLFLPNIANPVYF